MSAVTTCPKCNNTVTVPFGAANDAWVRCRSCGAEYTLPEIVPHSGAEIGLVPPTELELIAKPDHPAGPRIDHLAAFSPWDDEIVEVIEQREGANDFAELELADDVEVMDAEVVDAEIVDADVFDADIMEVDALDLGAEGAPENPSTISNKSDWSQQPTVVDIGEPLQLEEVADDEISLFDEELPSSPSPHDTLIYTGPGKRPEPLQDDKPENVEAASLEVTPLVDDPHTSGESNAAPSEPAPGDKFDLGDVTIQATDAPVETPATDEDFFNFLDEPQEADSGEVAELEAYENAFDAPAEGAAGAGSTSDTSRLDSLADDEPLSLDDFETIESDSESAEMDDAAAAAFLDDAADADGEPAFAAADSEDDSFEPIEMSDEDDAV
ncbi:MAG: hypothetical protein SGJ20_16715, partial [Planctomycetota bacterium]|nr:hypothetical protein [Planctomycetota bacterium]